MTLAGIPIALCKLAFCTGVLATGAFELGLTPGQMQTLTFVMLVFAGQGMVYLLRERGRIWSSRPSMLMVLFSLADVAIVSVLAGVGILMMPLPARTLATLFVATAVFVLALDRIKLLVFSGLRVD